MSDPCEGNACEPVCGDGWAELANGEACDDGNTVDGDGCSSTCAIEPGWTCPQGKRCQAAACGDGLVVGAEQCDDGNTDDGDGCSGSCLLENAPPGEKDGWVCPTPGQPCVRTLCGDGVAEGSEQCDDGNHDLGDGCTPFCRNEPSCPASGRPCTSACGDGVLLPNDKLTGQQCDDGNTASGDGCSSTCTLEEGFLCKEARDDQDALVLPLVVRDFKGANEPGGHPDFEFFAGSGLPGLVESTLGAGGKPVHLAENRVDGSGNRHTANQYSSGVLQGTDWFNLWFRDDPTLNKTVLKSLSFGPTTTGEHQYDAQGAFFPIDGAGWGNTPGYSRNYSFTSEVRHWFEYRGSEKLDFTGDDDVWVFVNKKLAVDLGGMHPTASGSVILNPTDGSMHVCDFVTPDCQNRRRVDLGLQLGQVYGIVVFQAERHTTGSNYRLTLSNFTSERSVCESICGDGIRTLVEECDDGKLVDKDGCDAQCRLEEVGIN